MQGLHTIDVATLENTVIDELLKGIAENANIKVFGSVSPMIAETFLPWFTKEVLR